MWPGSGTLLDAAARAGAWRHILALLGAGVLTGAGQLVLTRLSGNGIDITAAIWFHAGRLPPLRTLGSAVLSVVIVGMGASLGAKGPPSRLELWRPMPFAIGRVYQMSNDGCW
jgi:CIC family chloride channel protein